MEKRLKTGLICMFLAVLLMPVALLCGGNDQLVKLTILFLAMLLELIGLIFVILSVLKRRKG